MDATKWYEMYEQQVPGHLEQSFENLVNRGVRHVDNVVMAEFFQGIANSRKDNVKLTPITWKELREKRRWISRHYKPKEAPRVVASPVVEEPKTWVDLPDDITVTNGQPSRVVQPELELTPVFVEALLVALREHESALRENTNAACALEKATWALEKRLHKIWP